MKAGLKAIYLSGWQVAADANIAGEMYPGPVAVSGQLGADGRAQRSTTRSSAPTRSSTWKARGDIDFFAPIVADAEAGFGGVLNAFELMKAMIEAGAAGVHFEDQLASVKKCGHMGGKVLVPTREAVEKLIAARLAADCMGVPTIVLARTDAEAADLVTSDVDDNDKPFCTGERTVEGFYRTRNGLDQAVSRGLAYAPYADLIWCETGKPDLAFAKAFAEAIQAKFPGKLLAYNCSPSFNWKKNLDDATIARFQRELGAMGYKFQFITLAGFHSLNYSMFNLAHGYAREQHERVRRAAGSGVRGGGQGLHRGQAPARGRHRLLRRGDDDGPGQPVVDDGAQALDRGRAVLRRRWLTDRRQALSWKRRAQRPAFLFCTTCAMCNVTSRFARSERMTEQTDTFPPVDLGRETTPRVRAFYALVPDDSIRLQFLALARDVARRSRGRAISGEHVHLTLAFLGDVPATRVEELRAIGDALPHRGAALNFDTLGAWRASGVAWVAPSSLPVVLTELHSRLHDALTSAGFEMESRPFRPHVTLARRCVQPHPRAHCTPIHWPVTRLALIGSELRPQGPIHSTLREWALDLPG